MVTVIIGYINYTTESVPPSPSSKSVWACRIIQLKQFLIVISDTHSNFLPNKNEKGQLEVCEKTNTYPKLLSLAPFKTKAKALECPFFCFTESTACRTVHYPALPWLLTERSNPALSASQKQSRNRSAIFCKTLCPIPFQEAC